VIDGSSKTVNNVLSTLNKALKTAVEWKIIRAMPCTIRLLKVAPPEMSFYDSDEYERLVAAARAIDPRTHIAVLLGGDAGLRVSEVIALEQTDADYQRGSLNVQRAEWRGQVGLPKSGRPRRVPMTKRLSAALREHRISAARACSAAMTARPSQPTYCGAGSSKQSGEPSSKCTARRTSFATRFAATSRCAALRPARSRSSRATRTC
jgi:integrase